MTSTFSKLLTRSVFASMPKNKAGAGKSASSSSKGSTGNKSEKCEDSNVGGAVKLTKDGNISIAIQVKPGAKVSAVTGVSHEGIGVHIAAPPVDGEANTAIVKYFADVLGLKRTNLTLKGGKSRQKTVIIEAGASSLTAEQILDIFKKEVGK